jgi:hypothetical protein
MVDDSEKFDRHRELFRERRGMAAFVRWKISNWRGMEAAAKAKREARNALRRKRRKQSQRSQASPA